MTKIKNNNNNKKKHWWKMVLNILRIDFVPNSSWCLCFYLARQWFSCLPLVCAFGPATAAWFVCVCDFSCCRLFRSFCLGFVVFSIFLSSPCFRVAFFLLLNTRNGTAKLLSYLFKNETMLFFFGWFPYNHEPLTKYPMRDGLKL